MLYSESSLHGWYCTCHVRQTCLVCAVTCWLYRSEKSFISVGGHKQPQLPGRFLLLVFCGLSVLKSHPKSGYKLSELGACYDGLVEWSVEEVLQSFSPWSCCVWKACSQTHAGRAEFLKPPMVLSWIQKCINNQILQNNVPVIVPYFPGLVREKNDQVGVLVRVTRISKSRLNLNSGLLQVSCGTSYLKIRTSTVFFGWLL